MYFGDRWEDWTSLEEKLKSQCRPISRRLQKETQVPSYFSSPASLHTTFASHFFLSHPFVPLISTFACLTDSTLWLVLNNNTWLCDVEHNFLCKYCAMIILSSVRVYFCSFTVVCIVTAVTIQVCVCVFRRDVGGGFRAYFDFLKKSCKRWDRQKEIKRNTKQEQKNDLREERVMKRERSHCAC